MKQTSDKSEQAIRRLLNKLFDLMLRHTALSHSFSGASTTKINPDSYQQFFQIY